MTKPVSRLEWWADPLNPLAVRAKWLGSGWHYRLHWGHLNPDGTPAEERVLAHQLPVKHVYPAAGTYTLTAASEINKIQVSVQVTVRPEKTPQVTMTYLGGGRTRLDIKGGWPGELLHRVIWGDGTPPEDYSGTQLAPEHTYPPGTSKPQIVVGDVPARRLVTLDGPDVPIEPPATGVTTTWRPHLDEPGTGTLELAGFPPNTLLTLGPGTYSQWGDVDVTTDDQGRAWHDYVLWTNPVYDHWQSIGIRWVDPGSREQRQMWQPVNICEWTEKGCWWKHEGDTDPPKPIPPQSKLPVVLDWDIHRPAVITITVAPATNGTWTVQWGDGATEQVEVTGHRFTATRDYGRYGSYWITVTDPTGRVGRRRVRPIQPQPRTWKEDGSLAIFQAYEAHSNRPGEIVACDNFSVMRVDAGDGRPLRQIHRPSLHCDDSSAIGFSYARPGSYTVTIYGPMRDPVTYVHEQRTRSVKGRTEFPIFPPELDVVWRVATRQTGGYLGQFRIRNTLAETVPAWRLEFTLADPARIADVWGAGVQLVLLGGRRYALTSSTPLPAGAVALPGLRVESRGDPRVEPTAITATARQR